MTQRIGQGRGIVVIGASAGGVEALCRLASGLPHDIDAAVFVAVHVSPWAKSTLPAILNRSGGLPAGQATDAEPIRTGRIYVAPPDRHLLIGRDRIRVTRGPRENGHRPAIDALFRSAAAEHGPGVIGVVLSGILDDGSAGIQVIKESGGVGIVQADAVFSDMPRNAMEATTVDHVAPIDEIAHLLCAAVNERPPSIDDFVPRTQRMPDAPHQALETMGPATRFTCPACGGVLNEIGTEPPQFRCRVGHSYSGESLLAGQADSLEASLWTAVRALEERATLLGRIADRFRARGSHHQAERFGEDGELASRRAEIVRRALLDQELVEGEGPLPSSHDGASVIAIDERAAETG